MQRTARTEERGLPRLIQQNPAVLRLLYYWQYFDVDTLRCCFPDLFRSQRSTQDYLHRLRLADYIKSVEPGYQNQQHLHSVTKRTTTFLSNHYARPFPATTDDTVSPFNIEHERATSRFQSHLYASLKHRPDLSVPVYLRRFGSDPQSTLTYLDKHQTKHLLKPDLAFLLIRHVANDRRLPTMHFLETDRGTESMTVIKKKLGQYLSWLSYEGRTKLSQWYSSYDTTRPMYRLLVITRHRFDNGNHLQQLIKWYTQALFLDPTMPLFLTTCEQHDALRHHGSDAIWYPLHWFQADWLIELQNNCRYPNRRAYDYVANKLASWPQLHTGSTAAH